MADQPEPRNFEELLDRLVEAARDRDRISVDAMLEAVGRRSFGPILLVTGLIALSPLSGIPGMPTTVAAIVGLMAGQLLVHRKHFWLPRWVLKRSVSKRRFEKALRFLRPMARFVDRITRPRLAALTKSAGLHAIAILCLLIAATMPPMEVVPFAATTAGAALSILGLSLITHDGLLALFALLFTVGGVGLVINSLL